MSVKLPRIAVSPGLADLSSTWERASLPTLAKAQKILALPKVLPGDSVAPTVDETEHPVERPPIESEPTPNGEPCAAVFFSDFHMSDGSIGDDYLDVHLAAMPLPGPTALGGPPAPPSTRVSRAGLFACVTAWAQMYLQSKSVTHIDYVLNGDIIDELELLGRGFQPLSPKHDVFLSTCRALNAINAPRTRVYYLQGNHDPSPRGDAGWTVGSTYRNAALKVWAEHGCRWDDANMPYGFGPGLTGPPPGPNRGSDLVFDTWAASEIKGVAFAANTPWYPLAALDNLRPFSNDAVKAFLQRRRNVPGAVGGLGGPAAQKLLAALQAVSVVPNLGPADDVYMIPNILQDSLASGRLPSAGWITVNGHTHTPLVSTSYYNTGCWITSVYIVNGVETPIDFLPFLLVWNDAQGVIHREYFSIFIPPPPIVQNGNFYGVSGPHTRAQIDAVRALFGYPVVP